MGNQPELARLLGISSDYVSMIETGKRKPGPRLLKDFDELERKLQQAVSENPDSVKPPLALRDSSTEYLTIAECKQRIQELEAELRKWKHVVRELATDDISSNARLSEDQIILKRVGEKPDVPPPQ